MTYFPAFFLLEGRPALIVGGGFAASCKARTLADAGACVTVVAPALGEEMTVLVEEGSAHYKRKGFTAEDLVGQTLVVAASGIHAVDADVSAAAQARGLPISVINAPELSNFIIPTAEAVALLLLRDEAINCGLLEAVSEDDASSELVPATDAAKGLSVRKSANAPAALQAADVNAGGKLFEVRIPAINAVFVAREEHGRLMLTSMDDIPCLNVQAGQTLTAQEVTAALGRDGAVSNDVGIGGGAVSRGLRLTG